MAPEEEAGGPALRTFADRLNWLVDRAHPAGRGPYSNREIAALVAKVAGASVSGNTIWKLRNGQVTDPHMSIVAALARTFGVDPGFFFGDQDLPADQVELLTLIRDTGVTGAQLRAFATLNSEGREAVAALIEQTAWAEGRRPGPQRDGGA
jgi:transcriptional regulator with XRE-family HTH domain